MREQPAPRDDAELQTFLLGLGYLASPADSSRPEASAGPRAVAFLARAGGHDAATRAALAAFQADHGLPPTGDVDTPTQEAIHNVFCREGHSRVLDLALPGPEEKRVYSYRILNNPPRLPASDVSHAVAMAFSIWALHTPLVFPQVPETTDSDITISFTRMDGPGGVFGNALIELDVDEPWSVTPVPGLATVDLTSIALHEIGHRLGLNHSDEPGSVMWDSYSPGDRYRRLHSSDVTSVRALYGSPAVREMVWSHGASVTPEHPEALADFRPRGFRAVAAGLSGTSEWFHFPLPTPVFRDGRASRLHGIHLRLLTHSSVEIEEVHIWDGDRLLAKHRLDFAGHANAELPRRWDLRLGVADKPLLYGGVNVSVLIDFKFGSTARRRTVEFAGAGLALIDPEVRRFPPDRTHAPGWEQAVGRPTRPSP